jgi:hypothetical protein
VFQCVAHASKRRLPACDVPATGTRIARGQGLPGVIERSSRGDGMALARFSHTIWQGLLIDPIRFISVSYRFPVHFQPNLEAI